jgi:hypothetical protein
MPGVDISTLGRTDADLVALAMAGDVLATSDGRRVEVSSGVRSGALTPVATWVEPVPVGELALAPSGRHLLLRSAAGDAVEVRSTGGGPPLVRLEGEIPGRPLAIAAIAATPDGELLVASVERMRLQVRRLDTGAVLHDELVDRPRAFLHRVLAPMTDGDTMIAIGSYWAEMKESLVPLSLGRLLTEEGYLSRTLHRPPFKDYAHELTAGPCGASSAVFYRDPEDDEDPDEDDEEDPNRLDVRGIHGLYVRRLSGGVVVETIPIDAAVTTGAAMAGTEHHVVVALPQGALVVPRSGAPATLVPARLVAIDPRASRCVLASGDGHLRLLTLS